MKMWHKVKIEWVKRRCGTGGLCVRKIPNKMKSMFVYTLLYRNKYWASSPDKCRKDVDVKMDMRNTKLDKIKANHIKQRVQVANTQDNIVWNSLHGCIYLQSIGELFKHKIVVYAVQ